jgi:hypothetical protein
MRMRIAMAVLLATLYGPAFAQSNLAGVWAVDVKAAKVQTGDGTNWELVAISGTLTLEQHGDAVTGTWRGRMPDPWKITGRIEKNSFELQTEVRNLPTTKNGEKTTIARSWIVRGSINGNTLSGLFILAGGDGDAPAQPFTAARRQK